MECLLYTGVFQASQGVPSVALKVLCLTKAQGLVVQTGLCHRPWHMPREKVVMLEM